MGILERFGNGWHLAMTSLSVVRENRKLLLFPVISTLALLAVLAVFAAGVIGGGAVAFGGSGGPSFEGARRVPEAFWYAVLFVFLFVNYAVMIFFNMAMIHCSIKALDGETPEIRDGIALSMSRLGPILLWALVSATVGFILRVIEDRSDRIRSIVSGLLGMVWSLMTFFVVPIIAYEDVPVFEAIKRSGALFRRTWGERVGAGFALGLVNFLLMLLVALPLGILVGLLNPVAGVLVGMAAALVVACFMSAAEGVFRAAAYQFAAGKPTGVFDTGTMQTLFPPR